MSFLQWAGGKVKTLHYIIPHIPASMENYYEPFLGGGSVLLHVLQQADAGVYEIRGKVVASDINAPLIHCYQAIKEDVDAVVEAYERLYAAYESCPDTCRKHYCVCGCKECMYGAVRTLFNIYKETPVIPEAELAACFLFLNVTCYRGIYRVSKAGAFNTCYGSTRPIFPKSERIFEAARLFKRFDVTFEVSDVRDFWGKWQPTGEDFVYIDPPLLKESSTFTQNDAVWLQGVVKEAPCRVLLHTHVTEDTLNDTFANWPVCCMFKTHRSMAFKGSRAMEEVLLGNTTTGPTLSLASS